MDASPMLEAIKAALRSSGHGQDELALRRARKADAAEVYQIRFVGQSTARNTEADTLADVEAAVRRSGLYPVGGRGNVEVYATRAAAEAW